MINDIDVRSESLKLVFKTFEIMSNDVEALKTLETCIIDAFDAYLENCPSLNDYINQFITDNTQVSESIVNEIQKKNYIESITRLNNTLKQLANFSLSGSLDESSSILKDICAYNNALFFKSIDRYDLFIRNMYKLASQQENQENYLEAGCSLLEIANQLDWSENILVATDNYPKQMEYTRKTQILNEAIELLLKGKEYDKCIQISKILYDIYDNIYIDYNVTSQLLFYMSGYYKNVISEVRCEPEYFWVGFFGQSFHISIKNKEFIYRGKNFLKLGDLIKKLRTNFPLAEVSGATKKIGDDLRNSNKQVIFCSGISAVPTESKVLTNKYASSQIKNYYLCNYVNKFTRQRPIVVTENVKDKWVEEISFISEFIFPGPLDWAEIIHTDSFKISPIEMAISDVEKKTHTLINAISKIEASPDMNRSELCSLLNGIIDSAVNGGTSKYVDAFLIDEYLAENPNDIDHVEKLNKALIDQYNYTHKGLELHENGINEQFVGLHVKMVHMFDSVRFMLESCCHAKLEPYNSKYVSHNTLSDPLLDVTMLSNDKKFLQNRKCSGASISTKFKDEKVGKDIGSESPCSSSFFADKVKSSSVSSTCDNTNEVNYGTQNENSKSKQKNNTRQRSTTNLSIGSVSKKSKKSLGIQSNDFKIYQNHLVNLVDELQNHTEPFIMHGNSIDGKDLVKNLDNMKILDSSAIGATTGRPKSKFKLRTDKKRIRSKSVFNYDNPQ